LHDLNIDEFKFKLLDWTCATSPFMYNFAISVINEEPRIIENAVLQNALD